MAKLKKLRPLDFRRVFIIPLEREEGEVKADFIRICKSFWKDLAYNHSYASAATMGVFSPDNSNFSFLISIPIEKEFDMVDDINRKAKKHGVKLDLKIGG